MLEVTNTPWGERHWYVCDAADGNADGNDRVTVAKAMHVSPFLPMDVDYRITWTVPGADLVLRVEVGRAGHTVFDVRLDLRREALDRRTACASAAAGSVADAARLVRVSMGRRCGFSSPACPSTVIRCRTLSGCRNRSM